MRRDSNDLRTTVPAQAMHLFLLVQVILGHCFPPGQRVDVVLAPSPPTQWRRARGVEQRFSTRGGFKFTQPAQVACCVEDVDTWRAHPSKTGLHAGAT